MKLLAGKFYRSRIGELWCCYRVREDDPQHAQASCIRVEDSRIEYFYIDGRYDEKGEQDHTLVKQTH